VHLFIKSGSIYVESRQDQNDHQPIPHVSLNAFHQRRYFLLVIISNYPRRPHIAAVTWLSTNLLMML